MPQPILRFGLLALLAAIVLSRWNGGPQSEGADNDAKGGEVAVKLIKLKELTEVIQGQKGKVVLLDVWGEY
jgi:hypothetical protein